VGALDGPRSYRWTDSSETLQDQARLHAQVHQIAGGNPAYSGLLGWCGIDYASLHGGDRNWRHLRWPGVLDTFRVAKPGASFYRSQVSPVSNPVIIPAFYWDFGPNSPVTGPGANAMLFTNCDHLVIFVGAELVTVATPDTDDFGNLAYPPALVDLTVDGSTVPDLTVDGYYRGSLVATLRMSADTAHDRLVLDLEDETIEGDGSDATRLTFRAVDAYGNQRPYVSGRVTLSLTGPAVLIGQNPFAFQAYGGVGAVILRSEPGRTGLVKVTAKHHSLGQTTVKLNIVTPTGAFL
jgi:beta-galactosidase